MFIKCKWKLQHGTEAASYFDCESLCALQTHTCKPLELSRGVRFTSRVTPFFITVGLYVKAPAATQEKATR